MFGVALSETATFSRDETWQASRDIATVCRQSTTNGRFTTPRMCHLLKYGFVRPNHFRWTYSNGASSPTLRLSTNFSGIVRLIMHQWMDIGTIESTKLLSSCYCFIQVV